MAFVSEIVQAEGHLVDSQILTDIFDTIIACQATYEVLEFNIGRTNDEMSKLKLKVLAENKDLLDQTLGDLMLLGCYPIEEANVILKAADMDGCLPEDFYSTTNHKTIVRHQGKWLEVDNQRMDAAVCIQDNMPTCRKLRDITRGDMVVCGKEGIRVLPEFKARDRLGFAFMSNEVSSERRVETAVKKIADIMREIKHKKGKIVVVAGPVVVHTGGGEFLCRLIREGFVSVLLGGNAIAVHDIENSLYGTSLGVDLERGLPIYEGHKNHMRAINTIRRSGGIEKAVKDGVLKSGVMFECVQHKIPFVLAGSIRDDGPLPETKMDLIEAQDQYSHHLKGADLVVCLSSMLHSIGVGNMLPAHVKTICVDINPAVVTKLSDRGSSQALGVVTDVGLFLNLLSHYLTGTAGHVPAQEQ
jgi:lysine-ketoglutarate reductase/saccharopine dehydrogenase-like protein (TIGR00300 family)